MAKHVLYSDDPTTAALQQLSEGLDEIKDSLTKASQTPANAAPFDIRVGESALSSRQYSFARLAKGLISRDYTGCKIEMGVHDQLQELYTQFGWAPSGAILCPLASGHIPDVDVAKGVREMTTQSFDPDEFQWVAKQLGIRKDMLASTDTTGGTLIPLPAQGQLIDFLRNAEIFSRAGAQEVSLPVQGSVRYPRMTSDPTVYGVAEGGTITESTPGTGELTLTAKKYAALIDASSEFVKFAMTGGGEGVLRSIMGRAIGVEADGDMIDGQGGTRIKGVITYSGVSSRTATTVGGNGDTIGPRDPLLLLAELENANTDTTTTIFAVRPRLYARLRTLRGDAVSAADAAGPFVFESSFSSHGGAQTPHTWWGFPVLVSTNVPNTRAKGSGTTLTMILALTGAAWVIGRVGVIEVTRTDSHGSNFASDLFTFMKRSIGWANASKNCGTGFMPLCKVSHGPCGRTTRRCVTTCS